MMPKEPANKDRVYLCPFYNAAITDIEDVASSSVKSQRLEASQKCKHHLKTIVPNLDTTSVHINQPLNYSFLFLKHVVVVVDEKKGKEKK